MTGQSSYCSEKNEEDYYDYVVATFNDAKETGDTAPAVLWVCRGCQTESYVIEGQTEKMQGDALLTMYTTTVPSFVGRSIRSEKLPAGYNFSL